MLIGRIYGLINHLLSITTVTVNVTVIRKNGAYTVYGREMEQLRPCDSPHQNRYFPDLRSRLCTDAPNIFITCRLCRNTKWIAWPNGRFWKARKANERTVEASFRERGTVAQGYDGDIRPGWVDYGFRDTLRSATDSYQRTGFSEWRRLRLVQLRSVHQVRFFFYYKKQPEDE